MLYWAKHREEVEGKDMPNITIITPTRRELHASYVMSLLQAFSGMGGDRNRTGYTLGFRTLAGKSNIHHARSIAVSNWYDSAQPEDLMLFIDSDHTYDTSDILKAIERREITGADIICGVYSNSAGTRPNVYPKNPKEFMSGGDDEVWYGGTGFMLISKPILDLVRAQLKEEIGHDRIWISDADGERDVIPFFHSRFVENELSSENKAIVWLGEDYSFCLRVRDAGGTIRAFLSRTIGHDTTSIKYFYPDNYTNKIWDKDTLVYFCGQSRMPFSPNTEGLGGSEQAVVELAKRFNRSGKWKEVHVFGNVIKGTYGGVHYRPLEEFDIDNTFGDIILWRGFGNTILPQVKANRVLIDLHDNTDHRMLPGKVVNEKVNKVFVKSDFHTKLFPQIDPSKFVVIPNGVYDTLFRNPTNKEIAREPYRFCWTSSHERNLAENLEFIWPTIKRELPSAEFHIYYGDEFLNPDLKARLSSLMKQRGVFYHGRVPIKKIAEEKNRASFHLYVTDTNAEIDCISVRESAAAGCIPIISNLAVFSEREGYHVDVKDVRSAEEMEAAAGELVRFIKDSEKVRALRDELINSNMIFDWDSVSDRWVEALHGTS